jgi:hypothetical protein
VTTGFIRLSRKFFENPFWCEARIYSKGEAWLDLIQEARFEPSNAISNGKVIELKQGELIASIRYLAKRWNWGEQKVRTYLINCKVLGMITQRQHSGESVITLVNYGVYNDRQHSGEPESNTAITQRQHSDNTAITQSKRKKERKNLRIKEEGELPIGKPPPVVKKTYVLDVKKILQSELPFKSEVFLKNFESLLLTKNWLKKPETAVFLAIKKMQKYDENFVNSLMENAIIGGWQGLFFPNTDENYKKYLIQKNATSGVQNTGGWDKKVSGRTDANGTGGI